MKYTVTESVKFLVTKLYELPKGHTICISEEELDTAYNSWCNHQREQGRRISTFSDWKRDYICSEFSEELTELMDSGILDPAWEGNEEWRDTFKWVEVEDE